MSVMATLIEGQLKFASSEFGGLFNVSIQTVNSIFGILYKISVTDLREDKRDVIVAEIYRILSDLDISPYPDVTLNCQVDNERFYLISFDEIDVNLERLYAAR